ncbi:MAG: BamA/TamA family outer membrane protein [Saprospiraceae bacterium]|nr:BamA/TamA family outer membrane protein [Saprospiraceae bacterium]
MAPKWNLLLAIIVMVIFHSSCASFKTKISGDHKQWSDANRNPSDISHSVYLIGDAGAATLPGPNPALDIIQQELNQASSNSTCIFLGDNIYPDGLPPPSHPYHIKARNAIQAQLNTVENYPGKTYFIPGNHDWYGGLEDLKRQEDYVNEGLGYDSFIPERGCPGPEVIDLTEEISLVIIDSQWYLEDWTNHTDFNEKCEIKTRSDFIFELRDVIRKHKDKYLIIALHHPLESYGQHGGHFSFRSHMFPLTDVNDALYLPLPVVGSAIQSFKKNIGKVQDMNHPLYRELIQGVKSVSKGFNNIVFISGHEHNQQLIEKDGHWYVVSGAGSKREEVKMGVGSIFASGQPGYSRIDYYDDARVWISFFQVNDEGTSEKVFSKELILDVPDPANYFPEDFPIYYSGQDTIETSIYSDLDEKSPFYKRVFGEHYGSLYSIDIKAPVFDLFSFKEGLRPIKRGGGSQTNSLRLELPNGNQYVMRAIKKDVGKILPKGFAQTLASDLLEDQFMSAHPFAAFAIPGLAEAADIMHTHPELYYVPKQPALEYYNEYHGNELYLFEERPDGDRSDLKNFGYSKKIISTSDLLEELYTDKEAVVDQKSVIRARLFDILLNDWDRHDDQWRWAQFLENGLEVYRPIPRDRDQAFVKFDGWIPGILNNTTPVFRQMRSFDHNIPDVKAICHNARWFDRSFLNQLSWEDWQKEIHHLQATLTDSVINQSIAAWPAKIYDQTGEEIIMKLQSRVKGLEKYGREYFEFLYKSVDIVGTEETDTFKLKTLPDGYLEVIVSSEGYTKYQRTFDRKITKEIRMYGRSSTDVYLMNSSIASGIKLYLIGGPGKDIYTSFQPARLVDEVIIRENNDENFYLLPQAQVITSDKPRHYTYNRTAFEYNYKLFFPSISYNPDDGLMLGFSLNHVKHGFMKWPFSSKHNVSGSFGIASSSYRFNYAGIFTDLIKEYDFLVDVDIFRPQFVTNFFGFGNETEVLIEDRDFYRIKNRLVALGLGLQKDYQNGGLLRFGLLGETRKVNFQENSFLAQNEEFDPFYENQTFVGGGIQYELTNVDVLHNPTTGIRFLLGSEAKFRPANTTQRFLRLSAELTLYQEILDNRRMTLALRGGYKHQFGEVDFYQVVTIGGSEQIRGYRNQRFAGRSGFFANSDLRLKIGEISTYVLPFSYGINLGLDYGRVWIKEENSKKWHYAYGGGFWISPFDATTLRFNYFQGDEENRYTFGIGFFF